MSHILMNYSTNAVCVLLFPQDYMFFEKSQNRESDGIGMF
jgi:hypothetical protein